MIKGAFDSVKSLSIPACGSLKNFVELDVYHSGLRDG
jgi:hypothetical protein